MHSEHRQELGAIRSKSNLRCLLDTFSVRHSSCMATNQMAIFEHQDQTVQTQRAMESIKAVLYNKLFRQVVSGGVKSVVSVYDLSIGEKIFQFIAHERKIENWRN